MGMIVAEEVPIVNSLVPWKNRNILAEKGGKIGDFPFLLPNHPPRALFDAAVFSEGEFWGGLNSGGGCRIIPNVGGVWTFSSV